MPTACLPTCCLPLQALLLNALEQPHQCSEPVDVPVVGDTILVAKDCHLTKRSHQGDDYGILQKVITERRITTLASHKGLSGLGARRCTRRRGCGPRRQGLSPDIIIIVIIMIMIMIMIIIIIIITKTTTTTPPSSSPPPSSSTTKPFRGSPNASSHERSRSS
jgi:hypothetical protein